MDERSKDVIDDILGSSAKRWKTKSAPPPRPSRHDADTALGERLAREARERHERDRIERERREAAEAAFRRTAAFSENIEAVNTKNEVAILSINQAKACIVLRATVTDQISGEIAAISSASQRRWNDRDGVWELHPSIMPKLKDILKAHYKEVQVIGVQKQIPPTKFDQLLARLDSDDKSRIYKLLALKHHPDKGGDKDTMTLINLVFKGGA